MNCYLYGFIEQKWVDKEKNFLLKSHMLTAYILRGAVFGVWLRTRLPAGQCRVLLTVSPLPKKLD